MRIAVLGPLEVSTDDGRPVTVPGAKERLLLAVLAAGSPDVVSTDRIVETLWNGDRPASARKSLQVHLVHLRSALEPDRPRGATGSFVARRGTGYALTTAPEDVDALRFGDLAARGRARLTSGEPAEAVRLLSAALGLWRGEPYGDWPDASFADAERRRLTEVRTGAADDAARGAAGPGRARGGRRGGRAVLADDPLKEEWWRLLVLALYRAGRQGDALAAVTRARAVLAEQLGADPGPRLRAAEAAVLAQDPALDLPRRPSGRGGLPLQGPGHVPGRRRLAVPRPRPRRQPARRAAGRCAPARGLGSEWCRQVLARPGRPDPGAGRRRAARQPGLAGRRRHAGRRPVDALAALTGDRPPPDAPVLLVCDQFEELWAPGVDAAERTAFLDPVLRLLDDGVVVRCVAVVRGDHVGRLAEHAAFTERLGAALVLVPPMTDDELREVVDGPAAAVGLTSEPELLDAVVADVAGRPAALPLLSTALVGTWERRRGDLLTLAGYLEAGGVAGALARSAEAAYGLWTRRAASRPAGCSCGWPTPTTAARSSVGRCLSPSWISTTAARRAVVDAFVARRLLAVDGDVLDVVHEALLTAWPRLARWLEDDAAGRAVRRHLVPAARDWERGGEPDDELYRGARLGCGPGLGRRRRGEISPRWSSGSSPPPRTRSDAELTDARDRLRREVACPPSDPPTGGRAGRGARRRPRRDRARRRPLSGRPSVRRRSPA